MFKTMHNTISFTLSDIAEWAQGKGLVELPAFQRGLVWNAAQIEVLWDSLMRNIPIGTFSLLPMRGNERYSKQRATDGGKVDGERYFLLDGQQRANAISLAFQALPEVGDTESSILWVDLLPATQRSNRKTFFYVTTPARPWGYRIDDANGENRSGNVPVAQWRAALEEIEWPEEAGTKPSPAQLWPVCARFPVPVAALRKHGNLRDAVSDGEKNAPWAKHLLWMAQTVSMDELDVTAKELAERLESVIKNTCVTATVAPDGLSTDRGDGENSEIALYFTRLNRGGTTPSREDLDYSILKSILPELHQIDECAKGRMHPARLANLAMLSFLSNGEKDGWKRTLSQHDIFGLKDKADFARFVAEGLARDVDTVDAWLLGTGNGMDYGLPPYLRTRLARSQPNLYRFLLMLAARMRAKGTTGREGFAKTLVAFCTALAWFGKDGGMDFAPLAGCLGELASNAGNVAAARKILGGWMAAQMENGVLLVPPPPSYFEGIERATESGEMDAIKKAWSDPSHVTGANAIWNWYDKAEAGRGLVLYACRKYLSKTFGSYDPATAVWNEDARPWDYDHIVPQSWLKGTYHGDWHELVAELLNSIGNIAPIPFGANRSKNNVPPGEVALYADAGKAKDLFVDFGFGGRTPRFVHEYVLPECDKEVAFDFARVTAHRLDVLYREWWNTLDIGSLLAECVPVRRKKDIEALAEELRRRFPSVAKVVRIVYNAKDGTQRDVAAPWDWARPWVSCGIAGWWTPKGSDKRIRCFLARTFQEGCFEMGLRRHPNESTLDGTDAWWIERQFHNNGDFLDYAAVLLRTTVSPDATGVFVPEV